MMMEECEDEWCAERTDQAEESSNSGWPFGLNLKRLTGWEGLASHSGSCLSKTGIPDELITERLTLHHSKNPSSRHESFEHPMQLTIAHFTAVNSWTTSSNLIQPLPFTSFLRLSQTPIWWSSTWISHLVGSSSKILPKIHMRIWSKTSSGNTAS